jgi:hypothetical protein
MSYVIVQLHSAKVYTQDRQVCPLEVLGSTAQALNGERQIEERGHSMATNVEGGVGRAAERGGRDGVFVRLATETKQAFKTTEFWAMIAIVASILIASWVVDGEGGAGDAFPAVRAWLYVAIVAAAYIVSRGLAKAGSREPYWAEPSDLPGGPRGD